MLPIVTTIGCFIIRVVNSFFESTLFLLNTGLPLSYHASECGIVCDDCWSLIAEYPLSMPLSMMGWVGASVSLALT